MFDEGKKNLLDVLPRGSFMCLSSTSIIVYSLPKYNTVDVQRIRGSGEYIKELVLSNEELEDAE